MLDPDHGHDTLLRRNIRTALASGETQIKSQPIKSHIMSSVREHDGEGEREEREGQKERAR